MNSGFTPCPACARHVKQGDNPCPFCGKDIPFVARPAVRAAVERLSRSALLAAGTAGLALASDCSSSGSAHGTASSSDAAFGTGSDATPGDAAEEVGSSSSGSMVSLYGGPGLCNSSADCSVPGQVCAINAQLKMLLNVSLQTCQSPADDSGTEGGIPEGGSAEGGADASSTSGGDSG